MSRSYKKTPYWGDTKHQEDKRNANKAVRAWMKRNPEALPQKKSYRKIYESYDICDYCGMESWEQFLANQRRWHPNEEFNLQELRKEWEKVYKRK